MAAFPDSVAPGINVQETLLKYRAVIHEIGPLVTEFLPHGILIFFGTMAPEELREVSLIHDGEQLFAPLSVGDLLLFVPSSGLPVVHRITAVGEMANANLAELGHLVVHFDGAATANLPGTISVEPSLAELPVVGTIFELWGAGEKLL